MKQMCPATSTSSFLCQSDANIHTQQLIEMGEKLLRKMDSLSHSIETLLRLVNEILLLVNKVLRLVNQISARLKALTDFVARTYQTSMSFLQTIYEHTRVPFSEVRLDLAGPPAYNWHWYSWVPGAILIVVDHLYNYAVLREPEVAVVSKDPKTPTNFFRGMKWIWFVVVKAILYQGFWYLIKLIFRGLWEFGKAIGQLIAILARYYIS